MSSAGHSWEQASELMKKGGFNLGWVCKDCGSWISSQIQNPGTGPRTLILHGLPRRVVLAGCDEAVTMSVMEYVS